MSETDDTLSLSSSDHDSVDAPDTGTSAPSDAPSSPSSGETDATAPSSGEPKTELTEREGLLAAVQSAIAPKPDAQAPADASKDASGNPDTDKAAQLSDADADPTEDELRQYAPRARKRINRLLGERKEARAAYEAVQPELTAHRQLVGYLDQHQLAPDDVNLLLGVGASLRRGDYAAFLDGLEPYRQVALQALGRTAAPDLQGKVDTGELTDEAARELTRTRMEAARYRAEADTQTQRVQDNDRQVFAGQVSRAVQDWENNIKARDPDYALKEALIHRASQGLMASNGGGVRSTADAVALAQRAYDEVSAAFMRSRQAPQPTRPALSSASNAATSASAQPRSMLEAAMQGLDRARRA